MERVVSGIRSTGKIHLGNYYGAIKNFVKMQKDYECFFFVADYHSLTTHPNPLELNGNITNILSEYIGSGLDPKDATIFIQSDVREVAELYLLLSMHAYVGELERTVSFKDKIKKNSSNINAGLLTYPVLMGADILLHNAHKVPVGKDQEQHLEMTRVYARRFNNFYGVEYFNEPQPFNFTGELVKIPGLDGNGKMGKSEDNGIYLTDSDEELKKKIMKAVTDSGPTVKNSPVSEPVSNIFSIMEHLSKEEVLLQFKEDYSNCTIRYGDLKKQLLADTIAMIAPIRERILDVRKDKQLLRDIAHQGAEKARLSAKKTIEEVREIMGIKPIS